MSVFSRHPSPRATTRTTMPSHRSVVGFTVALSLSGGLVSCKGIISSPNQGSVGDTGGPGGTGGTAGTGRPTGAAGGTTGGVSTGGTNGVPPGPVGLDAGRTTMRRLDRIEYNNTVRDLLGTATTPADTFPADEKSNGFDTIGETLSISPVLTQQLEATATALVEELFARPATDPVRMRLLPCAPDRRRRNEVRRAGPDRVLATRLSPSDDVDRGGQLRGPGVERDGLGGCQQLGCDGRSESGSGGGLVVAAFPLAGRTRQHARVGGRPLR